MSRKWAVFISFSALLTAIALSLSACGQAEVKAPPPPPPPSLSSLNPTSSEAGGDVTIGGANFGDAQGNGVVRLGTDQVKVKSWSDTSIVFTVPEGITPGDYQVSVTTDAGSSDPLVLQIIMLPPPEISSLEFDLLMGGMMRIKGVNFGKAQGNSQVLVNGVAVEPVSWSDTSIWVDFKFENINKPGKNIFSFVVVTPSGTSNALPFEVNFTPH